MKRFFRKPYRWAAAYGILLTCFTAFVLLDTFVIPKAGTPVQSAPAETHTQPAETGDSLTPSTGIVVTDTSYQDENISITIETVRKYDTTFYIADVQLSDPRDLKTAFAQDTYGRNFSDTTSAMAEDNRAIFAVNGDYYGFRNSGFVLRNGVLYRDIPGTQGSEALIIDADGNFSVANENETDAHALADAGAWQIFSFGPSLLRDGEITVTETSEVDRAKRSNPRTAIGQVSALHYLFLVSDGRTSDSEGLTLLQLAQELYDRGCTVAYNLDGGGSSTMWFNGRVINEPTDGRSASERRISDIVYIG